MSLMDCVLYCPLAFFSLNMPESGFIASHLVKTNVCTTVRNSCHHHYCPCQSNKLMTSPPHCFMIPQPLLCPSLWLIELCHCQAPLGYFCQDAKSCGNVPAPSLKLLLQALDAFYYVFPIETEFHFQLICFRLVTIFIIKVDKQKQQML